MFQVVKERRWKSLQKLRDAASERARYSDYSVCLSNFNDVTAELLKKEEVIYHLECCKLATNKIFIDRLRKRPEAQPNALALDRGNCNTKEVEIVEIGEIFALKV